MRELDEALVREMYEAFSSGDVEIMAVVATDDYEHLPLITAIDTGLIQGHDAFRAYVASMHEVFADMSVTPLSIERVGEHFLVYGITKGTGRASGIALELTWWQVLSTRDGKFARTISFNTREEAIVELDRAGGLTSADAGPAEGPG